MSALIKQAVLPVLAYPLVVIVALVFQFQLLEQGNSIALSTYISIFTGISFILLFEYLIPYRLVWRPNRDEVKNDLVFTVLIQMLLPKILGFIVAVSLLSLVQDQNLAMQRLWPHELPIWIQVLIMLVAAEFLRYWLHRCSHHWSPLWRLHAVHHSPNKLYWLNTGRFHPVEKTIQFLFDALPFILLGVGELVLAVYFVFYAINGFFQHSNINLKMGWLNYVISGAELHRWHHAKQIDISGKNFGNNLIIWDLVFGTRYLPKDQQVSELGLFNSAYPTSFMAQMKTPATPGIDKYPLPILGLKAVYRNFLTQLGVKVAWLIYRLPFERALSRPMASQYSLLGKILEQNADTDFGIAHRFGKTKTLADYISNVPLQDYETLRPYIEKQERTKQSALTRQQPEYYAVTSGTTGQPKYIPVVGRTIKSYKRALSIFAGVQNSVIRHAFAGPLLAIPGAYKEGSLPGGTVYGAISGLMYYTMPRFLQKKYVAPNEVFGLADHALKYRLILRLALQHENLSYLATANPSTFLKLHDVMNEHLDSFAQDIAEGTFEGIDQVPSEFRDDIRPYLEKNLKRGEQLKRLAESHQSISFADVWPSLRLVVTWMGGSCGLAVDKVRTLIPKTTYVLEIGYLASELRGSITLEDTGTSGVPTILDAFYEFIETGDYERGVRQTKTLDQLERGHQYYVIITTPAGLYRYFINDIIEVTGFKKKTPLIKFIQKGKGVTNITGEKLAEQQLMSAIETINQKEGITVPFYIALASSKKNRYDLYIEAKVDSKAYATQLEICLQQANNEYASKRKSGRLEPFEVTCLQSGTFEAYKKHCVANGVRESQFKYLMLQNESDCDFRFEDYRL